MPLVISMLTAAAAMSAVIGMTTPDYPRTMRAAPWQTTYTTVKAEQPAAKRKEPREAAVAAAKRDVNCLASAIWHEAGNQSHEGRVAVAEVVIARMRSKRYPDRACAVIAQKQQFSFVRRGVIPPVPVKEIREMTRIAMAVLSGRERSSVRGAMWFHATYVNPGWKVQRLGTIGQHVFYGERAS